MVQKFLGLSSVLDAYFGARKSSNVPPIRGTFASITYIVVVVSTAVSSSAQSIGDSFQGLPCFIGRALLLGWWSNMDDQLRASNTPMIMKLYEAALSIPIRMRLNPTFAQVAYDTITHSENSCAPQGATIDSCFDFLNKVRHLGHLQAFSQRNLVK